MSKTRAHCWYRVEAERLRARAAAIKEDDHWRDSYLRLARAYERIADVLEGDRRRGLADRLEGRHSTVGESAPRGPAA